MLASRDGKIVFENTLDARLEVVFRKKLPEVPPNLSSLCSLFSVSAHYDTNHMELADLNYELYSASKLSSFYVPSSIYSVFLLLFSVNSTSSS